MRIVHAAITVSAAGLAMSATASGQEVMTKGPPPIAPSVRSVLPAFVQPSMNVYRRFAPEHRAAMVVFYRDVLGLKPLAPIQLTNTFQMILMGVGSGQIKLASELKAGRSYRLGEIGAATGIRYFALTFADEAALAARFQTAGLTAPRFNDLGGGRRAALVRDPAGFPLELIVAPGLPASAYRGVEVGIAVSDLSRSRAFYRDFVGLDPLSPETDPLLGLTTHPYRHGETTLKLFEIGKGKPADTGSAGIQYVIDNIEPVNAEALARGVAVETPLGGIEGFPELLTVWLNDPDGATNYFYERKAPPPAAKPAK